MELKLYDITTDSEEFNSLLNKGIDKDLLIEAGRTTYDIMNAKKKSDIITTSFPSELEFIAIVEDTNDNKVLLSINSYFKMMCNKYLPNCKVLEVSPILKECGLETSVQTMFNLDSKDKEAWFNKQLLWVCNMSRILKENSEFQGVTSDYRRLLATEYMNDYSYGVYTKYNLNLDVICKILNTRKTYKNLEKVIEIIVTGEAIRVAGKDFHLYNMLPKYKFISSFIDRNMSVNQIIKEFNSRKKHMVNVNGIEEYIQGKDCMVDYKDKYSPIMYVVDLSEERIK